MVTIDLSTDLSTQIKLAQSSDFDQKALKASHIARTYLKPYSFLIDQGIRYRGNGYLLDLGNAQMDLSAGTEFLAELGQLK